MTDCHPERSEEPSVLCEFSEGNLFLLGFVRCFTAPALSSNKKSTHYKRAPASVGEDIVNYSGIVISKFKYFLQTALKLGKASG